MVILAAGKGTRMNSQLPKVLHRCGGLTLLEHSLRSASSLTDRPIVVVAAKHESVRAELDGRAEIAIQERQGGTGDALLAARSLLDNSPEVLVLPADMPLLGGSALDLLARRAASGTAGAVVAVARVRDARGYGRIRRDDRGELVGIVEEADEPWDGQPAEVNAGAYCFRLPDLWPVLETLGDGNAQGERYLSWAPARMPTGVDTVEVTADDAQQVNDRVQLAQAEALLRRRTLLRLMHAGVTVVDPGSTWVDCDVEVGQDTVLEPGTVLRGGTRIGRACHLGPFAELENAVVGDGCRISRAHLVACKLADGVDIGPFNRLRAGTEMAAQSHLGTFTEVVRSYVGAGSQVPHLSYIGDADLGEDVNIGAGTITANWDGRDKHRTVVESGARIGSNTVLVAPTRVGSGAYTGAGSVITADVPPGALAVSRARQRNVMDWVRRRRRDPAEGGS